MSLDKYKIYSYIMCLETGTRKNSPISSDIFLSLYQDFDFSTESVTFFSPQSSEIHTNKYHSIDLIYRNGYRGIVYILVFLLSRYAVPFVG